MSEADDQLRLAEENMKDFENMSNISLRTRYSTLYYAAYHSVSAVLIKNNFESKTHSGTDSLVRNILFKEKSIFNKDEVEAYSKLRTRREQADYESDFFGSEEELDELKSVVQDIIDKSLEEM